MIKRLGSRLPERCTEVAHFVHKLREIADDMEANALVHEEQRDPVLVPEYIVLLVGSKVDGMQHRATFCDQSWTASDLMGKLQWAIQELYAQAP
jgi:hypothetical protein